VQYVRAKTNNLIIVCKKLEMSHTQELRQYEYKIVDPGGLLDDSADAILRGLADAIKVFGHAIGQPNQIYYDFTPY
jgi:hypothetical protein